MAQIDRTIVGESARWGDTRSSTPHTRQDWVAIIENNVLDPFIQPRSTFAPELAEELPVCIRALTPRFSTSTASISMAAMSPRAANFRCRRARHDLVHPRRQRPAHPPARAGQRSEAGRRGRRQMRPGSHRGDQRCLAGRPAFDDSALDQRHRRRRLRRSNGYEPTSRSMSRARCTAATQLLPPDSLHLATPIWASSGLTLRRSSCDTLSSATSTARNHPTEIRGREPAWDRQRAPRSRRSPMPRPQRVCLTAYRRSEN